MQPDTIVAKFKLQHATASVEYNTILIKITPPPQLNIPFPLKNKLIISFFSAPVSEFNEFEPRLKSTKNRVQLSAGLNLETLNTIFC